MTKPHLTNIPTASEIALQRALDKAGWTMEEYVRRLDSLRDENESPHCEGCGQVEKKRKSNGEIKSLTLNLKEKKLYCESCSVKRYKQQQRENVSKRHDRDSVATGDEFWKRNRAKLSEAQRTAYEERDEEINLLADEMKNALVAVAEGRDFDEPALREFIREVCREILDNGTVFVDLTLTDFFRPERKDLYDYYVSQGGANARFLQYGYFDAIPVIAPNSIVSQFFEFVERRFGLPTAIYETHATRIERILDVLDYGKVYQQPSHTVKCVTPLCTATKSFQAFEVVPPQWFCPSCEAAGMKKAREVASRLTNQRLADQQRDSARDSYGRIKDSERIYGEDGKPFIS